MNEFDGYRFKILKINISIVLSRNVLIFLIFRSIL